MSVTLEQVNKNVLSLKKEIDEIREMLEESNLELADDIKKEIEASRKRLVSEFKSQDYMEKKFL
ncbi:MAG: hypothetical protein HY513_05915 [Candidatus Aenigmarchaeota archaeon]|nr:hypothetical protein [Candidatus Aenigmarchaeota archaeon]